MAAVAGCFTFAKQLARSSAVAQTATSRWAGRSACSFVGGRGQQGGIFSGNTGGLMVLADSVEWSPIVMMNRNGRKPKAANRGKRPVCHHNRKKRKGRVSVKNGRIVR
jgi:hypothetical protein